MRAVSTTPARPPLRRPTPWQAYGPVEVKITPREVMIRHISGQGDVLYLSHAEWRQLLDQ